jgi:hypothetical protein
MASNITVDTLTKGATTLNTDEIIDKNSKQACKAWVNFDGTTNTAGNCTIRGQHNVSSVADNGSGDYTINFTTAITDANYSVVGMATESSTYGYVDMYLDRVLTVTTSSCRVQCINHSSSYTDPDYAMIQVFSN